MKDQQNILRINFDILKKYQNYLITVMMNEIGSLLQWDQHIRSFSYPWFITILIKSLSIPRMVHAPWWIAITMPDLPCST